MTPSKLKQVTVYLTVYVLLVANAPKPLHAQFGGLKERMIKTAVCGSSMMGGFDVSKKLAEMQAKQRKMTGVDAQKLARQFEIGLVMQFCSNSPKIAGTTFSKLSEQGKKDRKDEMDAAVKNAAPETYKDPGNSALTGTLTPEPMYTDGKQECQVVEDHLADGSSTDAALVKYCRNPPDGEWKIAT